ncbi:hypothetical protein GR158_01795 [Shinella sp. AETb1-6]|uniref:Uncharacterized protein n=1 Tax=Shinella sumterensis TaxID=1967501 RepID=A0AA50CL86_9HYPH|nr:MULTISPECIES: hypothetical protein [Shinella]MXN49835.1 hypothetical protein [Shinella sp. AETb1-6]UPA23449.1 hypothetical protein K6301_09595 [Shinella oryzae]WLR98120.1 hypothetical protein Q9313_03565 [Shinella sumterensis]
MAEFLFLAFKSTVQAGFYPGAGAFTGFAKTCRRYREADPPSANFDA